MNWGGELPVVIQLASRDVAVASHQAPAPLAMMIPRRSYLPLIVDELVKHFGGAVLPMNAKPSSVWLGCGESPLPWYERDATSYRCCAHCADAFFVALQASPSGCAL